MKLTVVIPVYNEEKILTSCLESLRSQTLPADEIIIVDNGSTDTSAAIARSFGVTVISEDVRGIWPAAARGYDEARGDIIVRCDADTVVANDWLSRIATSFEDDTSQIAITGPGVFYDSSPVIKFLLQVIYMKSYFFFVGSALTHPPLFGSNFALRRDAWLQVNQEVHRSRTDIHDDIDLSYHLYGKGNIRYDPTLTVGISPRPFSSFSGMVLRTKRGFRSIQLHTSDASPVKRYKQLLKRS